MNPWAIVLVMLAVVALIVGVKGTQDNLIAAVLDKPYGNASPNIVGGFVTLPAGSYVDPEGLTEVPNPTAGTNPLLPGAPTSVGLT